MSEKKEVLDDYEKIRQENIERNRSFLDSIGIQNVKADIDSSQRVSKPRATSKGISSSKKRNAAAVPLPPRRSGRVTIERLRKEIEDASSSASADFDQLEQKREELKKMMSQKASNAYEPEVTPVSEQTRHTSDPISIHAPVNEVGRSNENENVGSGLVSLFRSFHNEKKGISSSSSLKYRSNIENLRLDEADVAKVVPQRVTSLTFHPADDRTLIICGDKQGHVGFWNATNMDDANSEIYLYQPHFRNVSCLHVDCALPHKLWSTGYDGTIRAMDIESQAFIEKYRPLDDLNDTSFHDCAFNLNTLYLGCGNGDVMMYDAKSGTAGWKSSAHDAKINSLQVHPCDENIVVSASSGMNGYIAAHDIRKVSSGGKWKPLFTLNSHSRSINAAYLSPKGEYLVSVSLDNTVVVWSDIMNNWKQPPAKVSTSFHHDNHTGRWLSTFKPNFDPKAKSSSCVSFSLGSMAKPRRVEVFTLADCCSESSFPTIDPVINLAGENLASVCSRNCFHPSKNIFAGGNSSGRVHLFR